MPNDTHTEKMEAKLEAVGKDVREKGPITAVADLPKYKYDLSLIDDALIDLLYGDDLPEGTTLTAEQSIVRTMMDNVEYNTPQLLLHWAMADKVEKLFKTMAKYGLHGIAAFAYLQHASANYITATLKPGLTFNEYDTTDENVYTVPLPDQLRILGKLYAYRIKRGLDGYAYNIEMSPDSFNAWWLKQAEEAAADTATDNDASSPGIQVISLGSPADLSRGLSAALGEGEQTNG